MTRYENDVFSLKQTQLSAIRNFEITYGVELLQTNESVKAGMTQLKTGTGLERLLNGLFSKIRCWGKFSDLKDAAYKLKNNYKDDCNDAQKRAITGKGKENCDEPPHFPEQCKDADSEFRELICMPNGLYEDAVSILKASSDVIGVQIFSNIDTLDQLQKELTEKSTGFENISAKP
jgi:hypothetical protein